MTVKIVTGTYNLVPTESDYAKLSVNDWVISMGYKILWAFWDLDKESVDVPYLVSTTKRYPILYMQLKEITNKPTP